MCHVHYFPILHYLSREDTRKQIHSLEDRIRACIFSGSDSRHQNREFENCEMPRASDCHLFKVACFWFSFRSHLSWVTRLSAKDKSECIPCAAKLQLQNLFFLTFVQDFCFTKADPSFCTCQTDFCKLVLCACRMCLLCMRHCSHFLQRPCVQEKENLSNFATF